MNGVQVVDVETRPVVTTSLSPQNEMVRERDIERERERFMLSHGSLGVTRIGFPANVSRLSTSSSV